MTDPWTVRRWMSTKLETLGPEDRLIDAFELMRTHRIRHIPILADGRLVGIISDRDIRHALPLRAGARPEASAAYAPALFETKIELAMTRHPITTDPDATLREAAEVICRERIGALPVVAADQLVGIVSAEDLLWAFLENTSGAEYGGGEAEPGEAKAAAAAAGAAKKAGRRK